MLDIVYTEKIEVGTDVEISAGAADGALIVWFENNKLAKPSLSNKIRMSPAEILNDRQFKKLQQGDQAVFKLVYDQYFGLVHYVTKRCGLPDDESLDIVQDTFIKLYHKAKQIKSHQALKSWLITSARNQALDYLRKQKVVQRHAESQHIENNENIEITGSITGHYNDTQKRELELLLVGELIEEVTLETGDETFAMFYRDGFSAKEIASHLNEPISTITNRLSRLRKRFRDKFASHLKKLQESMY